MNKQERKAKRHEKLFDMTDVGVAYLGGIITCIVCIIVVTRFLGAGTLLLNKDYEEYKGLQAKYGKYYELTSFLEKYSLYDYKADEIPDSAYKKEIEKLGDDYAEYYTAEEYSYFESRFEDSFGGVGLSVITKEGEGLLVEGVIEDSPAEKAGIKKGDIVLKVDGVEYKDQEKAVKAMRGKEGSKVTLTVSRDGKLKDYELTRAAISQISVGYSVLDKKSKIGYIAIAMFRKGTAKEFKQAVKALEDKGIKKIVIDLRNNGGGLTSESFKIADYLLPECVICKDVDKNGEEKLHKSDADYADIEFVMLVNGNTASASEILCAAVQDAGQAKLIGSTTYGKGVVQTTHVFGDSSAIKLTVEEYYRPSGKKVNGVGVTPDYEIEDSDAIIDKAKELLE